MVSLVSKNKHQKEVCDNDMKRNAHSIWIIPCSNVNTFEKAYMIIRIKRKPSLQSPYNICTSTPILKPKITICVPHTSPWGVPKTSWAQRGPHSDTWDFWHHWWEGPSDQSMDESPGRWEHFLYTKTRSHEGKAMSYAYGFRILKNLKNTSIGGVS